MSSTVRRAARILTGSEFSRDAMVRVFGIDPGRITVVPNAAAPIFRPLMHEDSAAWVRKRFEISGPYVLTVGDLQSRKNQAGLIRAFAALMRERPELPHRLVLAGKESWHADVVYRAAMESGISERIHFIGFVSDDELVRLYNGCELFAFPSFYEGFGLPVLEAMACGRPVACSNDSAVCETADSCAILFDPYSTTEMVRAIRDLVLDTELRNRMGRLGLQRAGHFNWRKTADKTLQVYHDVASSRTGAASAARVSTAAAG